MDAARRMIDELHTVALECDCIANHIKSLGVGISEIFNGNSFLECQFDECYHELNRIAEKMGYLDKYCQETCDEIMRFVSEGLSSNGGNAELIRKHYGAWIPEEPLILKNS